MWMCWADGMEDAGINTHKILETPFDWNGYDKLYWWGKSDVEPEKEVGQPVSKSFEEIIQQGESNKVEFKPCLVYNFKTGKGGIGVKEIIAKTICGFLNSNGGILFIGIKDNRAIQGLHFDFSLANGKDVKDFFQLEFDQMLQHFLGFSVISNISCQFYEIEGKEIFAVEVFPSKGRAIFVKGQKGKEFYVRGEASTRQIEDIEEIVNYCVARLI